MARVLVIDDDPVTRSLVTGVLQSLGHGVVEASHGRGGLDAFAAEPADMVVTDIIMPDQEGIETIRALRALDPHVPIIAMSGSSSADMPWDYLKLALALGASATIYKPFTPDRLIEEITRLLPAQR